VLTWGLGYGSDTEEELAVGVKDARLLAGARGIMAMGPAGVREGGEASMAGRG
jgi:hypothetical protein